MSVEPPIQAKSSGRNNELQIQPAPVLLGNGVRLFDQVDPERQAGACAGDRLAQSHASRVPRRETLAPTDRGRK
jgi:hypothetical protein